MSDTYRYSPFQITKAQKDTIIALAKNRNTRPVHILDTSVALGRYDEMSQAFSGNNTVISYFVKGQSNETLLADIIDHGMKKEKEQGQSRLGMAVANAGEIKKCIEAAGKVGITREEIAARITLANPNMQEEDIVFALDAGVRNFVVQNPRQLLRLFEKAKEHGVQQDVGIITRILPKAQNPGSDKFGADSDTCKAMLRFARNVGMKPKGLACHMGWQIDTAQGTREATEYAFASMADIFKTMKEEHNVELSTLDLGGGQPNQFNGSPVQAISANAAIVNNLMHIYFPDDKPEIMLEPGNYLSAAAGVTKANLINIDDMPGEPRKLRCVLNAGMFNGGLVDGHYPVSMLIGTEVVEAFAKALPSDDGNAKATLFGPSGISYDKVLADIVLVDNPKVRNQIAKMMKGNDAAAQLSDALEALDKSGLDTEAAKEQKEHLITEALKQLDIPPVTLILHGTGAYTNELSSGESGKPGFNSILNPEVIVISAREPHRNNAVQSQPGR